MDVVYLTTDEIEYLARVFFRANDGGLGVRVAFDGGLKVSLAQGMWTSPMGSTDPQ